MAVEGVAEAKLPDRGIDLTKWMARHEVCCVGAEQDRSTVLGDLGPFGIRVWNLTTHANCDLMRSVRHTVVHEDLRCVIRSGCVGSRIGQIDDTLSVTADQTWCSVSTRRIRHELGGRCIENCTNSRSCDPIVPATRFVACE